MIVLKTNEEIERIRTSALMVSKTLGMLATEISPGVTSIHLDNLAEAFIRDHGGIPGFLGMYGFPNTLCTSINNEVVHGIPSNKPLKEGDVISIDCGVLYDEFYGDHAYTFAVGEVSNDIKELLDVTKESLYKGISAMRRGNRIGDIGNAIQRHCENKGYGVVRELVGHGLGKKLHEDPQVPNYGKRGSGKLLQDGMVLAIEPMVNLGTHRVRQLKDGWSIVTGDEKVSAHFEHDVAIIDGRPEILSTFDFIYDALGVIKKDIVIK
ncbi:MAG: Methionine aminopeptidase 1 [Owenweeksia sp. TMED14]|nr:MAG: Methionine aminopeptidase 1 [Owenweeksia sp. TMED14]|tara:strand:+ start:1204 stop:2001 length:798 start_codon:yes stop_codon:yes gene_type:complete